MGGANEPKEFDAIKMHLDELSAQQAQLLRELSHRVELGRSKIPPKSLLWSRLFYIQKSHRQIHRFAVDYMSTLRFEKFWVALGFGFVGLVFYLSLAHDLPDTGVPNGMKIGHVLAYAWLMLWFAQIYRSNAVRCAGALTFCMMGVGLEYVQGLTDYRGFEYSDMLINSAGVGIGLLLSHTPFQNTLRWVEWILVSSAA